MIIGCSINCCLLTPLIFFSWVCQIIQLAFGSSFGGAAANEGNDFKVSNIYAIKMQNRPVDDGTYL